MKELNNTYLYHVCDKKNLPSILAKGGLTCKNQLTETDFTNIAHSTVQGSRSNKTVPQPPHGNLHDYVPFYFGAHSPMLFTIHKGNVIGCESKQEDIIYLVTSWQKVLDDQLEYVYTDGHGIMTFTEFYKDPEDRDAINWNYVEGRYWADDEEHPDRKRKKQAEFLVHQKVPLESILGIVCYSEAIKTEIDETLSSTGIETKVLKSWYY